MSGAVVASAVNGAVQTSGSVGSFSDAGSVIWPAEATAINRPAPTLPFTDSFTQTNGKLLGMMIPVLAVCTGSMVLFFALAATQYGVTRVAQALPLTSLYALVVVAFLYLLTAGSWVLIVAAMVKTSRAGQQIAGVLIAVSVAIFTGLGFIAANIASGWGLVVLGAVLVAADVFALEIARRVWRREEVLAKL